MWIGIPCNRGAAIRWTTDSRARTDRATLVGPAAARRGAPAALGTHREILGSLHGARSPVARLQTRSSPSRRAAGGGPCLDHGLFDAPDVRWHRRAGVDASLVSPAAVASALAQKLGARGPAQTISLACSSGAAAAIAEGPRAIRLGACASRSAAGVGADVDALMFARKFGPNRGPERPGAVSCPFDLRRDGFVVGEGAAMVVLSHERRGLVAWSFVGEGRSLDAHHFTAPASRGSDGAARSIRAALAQAGLSIGRLHSGARHLDPAE